MDTPPKLFRQRAREWAEAPALRAKRRGLWQGVSWAGYYERARAVGLGLAALGLARGDRLAVLAENRPEWLYVDLGAQGMGFVGNGIYPTSSPEQVAHVLVDSGCAVLFVENQEQLDKALAVRGRCPALRRIVVMEREGLRHFRDAGVGFFDDLLEQGLALARTEAGRFDAAIDAGRPADIAFLVYTSGTTGAPKGAMITHANVMAQIAQAPGYLGASFGDRTLSFLPLCHIAERMASVFNPLAAGLLVHFPESAGTVFNDLREVEPQVVFAPPRFWEKLHSQVELAMRDAVAPARWVYERARALPHDSTAPATTPPMQRLLRSVAFHNIRRFLGLARLKTALTGAAPVPPELVRWFQALGIELREAFGMTETCGFVTATLAGRVRLGWCGVPGPGIQIRLGAENELLVRGPNVFAGYWGQPEKTAEALDAEGWLHTGDCAEISGEGELAIRDRLKDILITSGGKNITPSAIENLLKFSPYITDAVAVGDGRHYVTALVMLDHEQVARFARDRQVPYTDYASLARAEAVVALVRDEVERANAQLARVEQVKDFRIIDTLLTAEDEELTPTMKLKRRFVLRKYADLIATMYP
ncbi:MAG: long-chain fatty acid--CoA ligase [Rubrivivax sp.]|nr:long-chain fatty acid--CoA ligase [Rubrivivax sp.]